MSWHRTVSVVVPTKDRHHFLDRIVPSYLAQPELGELIMVDDGSGPETAAVLERLQRCDPRIRVVRHPVNRGIPAAKNSGIAAATLPFVLFGEDDLELTEGYLATLFAHREASGADIVSGRNVWRFESESAEEALIRCPDKVKTAVDRRRVTLDQRLELEADTEELLLPATMLAPREVFARLRFDEGYRDSGWREESDFQLRAVASSLRLVACPHAVSFNYMIDGDRGGAHASIGLRRLYWQYRNNRRFVVVNAGVIGREFEIGNRELYLLRTLLGLVWREIVFSNLLIAARRARRLVRRESQS